MAPGSFTTVASPQQPMRSRLPPTSRRPRLSSREAPRSSTSPSVQLAVAPAAIRSVRDSSIECVEPAIASPAPPADTSVVPEPSSIPPVQRKSGVATVPDPYRSPPACRSDATAMSRSSVSRPPWIVSEPFTAESSVPATVRSLAEMVSEPSTRRPATVAEAMLKSTSLPAPMHTSSSARGWRSSVQLAPSTQRVVPAPPSHEIVQASEAGEGAPAASSASATATPAAAAARPRRGRDDGSRWRRRGGIPISYPHPHRRRNRQAGLSGPAPGGGTTPPLARCLRENR